MFDARRAVSAALCLVVVLAWGDVTRATVGAVYYAKYTVTGFTADGRHVYFAKKAGNVAGAGAGVCDEAWLVIFNVAKRRRVRSAPMYRVGADCSKKRISKAWGKVERKRLYKRYGAPNKGIQPYFKRKRFRAKAVKDIVVWGKVSGKYGQREGFANFDVTVWAKRGKKKKQRLGEVTLNVDEDDPPSLSDVMLSPDRKHVAFTVESQPRLVRLR